MTALLVTIPWEQVQCSSHKTELTRSAPPGEGEGRGHGIAFSGYYRGDSVIPTVRVSLTLYYEPKRGLRNNTVRFMRAYGDQLKYSDPIFCLINHKIVAL